MHNTLTKMTFSFLMIAGITALTTAASAQSCEIDEDCAEGQICDVVAASTSGCPPCPPCEDGEECPPCECDNTVEEIRECVEDTSCESDNDCAEGLTCVFGGVSDAPCAIDPDGEEDCPEPEPMDNIGYCEFVPQSCGSDSECPEYYSCQVHTMGTCSVICDEMGNCVEECDAEPENTSGYCIPDEIVCSTDNDCPSEWTCVTFEEMSCVEPAIDCECPPCREGEMCPPCDCGEGEVDCSEEDATAEMMCVPDELVELVESGGGANRPGSDADTTGSIGSPEADSNDQGAGSADGDTPSNTAEAADDTNTDESSCSVTPSHTPKAPGVIAMLAMFAMLTVIRRRA